MFLKLLRTMTYVTGLVYRLIFTSVLIVQLVRNTGKNYARAYPN